MAGRHLHAVRGAESAPVDRSPEAELADLFATEAALKRSLADVGRAIDQQRERYRHKHALLARPADYALRRQFGPDAQP